MSSVRNLQSNLSPRKACLLQLPSDRRVFGLTVTVDLRKIWQTGWMNQSMQNANDRMAQFDGGFGSCCVSFFQLCTVIRLWECRHKIFQLLRVCTATLVCSNHCSFLLVRHEIMQTQPLRLHDSLLRCADLAGTLASNRVGGACCLEKRQTTFPAQTICPRFSARQRVIHGP